MPDPNPDLHNPHFPGQPLQLEGPRSEGVLLFHGFTATSYEVYQLAQCLNGQGYPVCAPLMAGHGTHPDDLNRVRWQDWAAQAEAAYADMARRCQRVIVGGESNGGLIALYLASRHPEIAAVLAYAPALVATLSPLQKAILPLLSVFRPYLPKPHIDEDTTWQGYFVNPLKGAVQHLRFQSEVRAHLPQVTSPIIIFQGLKDITIDIQSSQQVYDSVGSTVKKLVWLDDSDHCLLLDVEKDQVHQATLAFLNEVLYREASSPQLTSRQAG